VEKKNWLLFNRKLTKNEEAVLDTNSRTSKGFSKYSTKIHENLVIGGLDWQALY